MKSRYCWTNVTSDGHMTRSTTFYFNSDELTEEQAEGIGYCKTVEEIRVFLRSLHDHLGDKVITISD